MRVTERLIFCDKCGNNWGGDDRSDGLTFKQMLEERRLQGWVKRGSKDYCEYVKN